MSFPATIPVAMIETILAQLAMLLLQAVGGDMAAATQAARESIANYLPRNEDEFRLAAETVTFGLQALEALGRSNVPDLPLTKLLQLRKCALGLSRQSHKSRQMLAQLQNERKAAARPAATASDPAPTVDPDAVDPDAVNPDAVNPEAALITPAAPAAGAAMPPATQAAHVAAVVEKAREIITSTSRHPGQTWNQAYEQKMRTHRLTEKMKQNHARNAASRIPAVANT